MIQSVKEHGFVGESHSQIKTPQYKPGECHLRYDIVILHFRIFCVNKLFLLSENRNIQTLITPNLRFSKYKQNRLELVMNIPFPPRLHRVFVFRCAMVGSKEPPLNTVYNWNHTKEMNQISYPVALP